MLFLIFIVYFKTVNTFTDSLPQISPETNASRLAIKELAYLKLPSKSSSIDSPSNLNYLLMS